MKKILSALLCMCVATSLFAQSKFNKDGIYYSINPNQKDVTVVACPRGSSYSGAIVIPQKVVNDSVTYSVTHIGAAAFKKSSITSVAFPNGLIEIGESAFRECQQLKSVTIPASVVNIEREAFIFCFSLSSLTFKGVKMPTIGSYAFGKTLIKKKGIDTGIPANMFVPEKDSRYKVNSSGGYVVY